MREADINWQERPAGSVANDPMRILNAIAFALGQLRARAEHCNRSTNQRRNHQIRPVCRTVVELG
jgi:hypothetical protein